MCVFTFAHKRIGEKIIIRRFVAWRQGQEEGSQRLDLHARDSNVKSCQVKMIAAAWEYGGRPVQFLSEYGSSGSSSSAENDYSKSIRSEGDISGTHAGSTESKLCGSKSNNWGELQTDPPNLYDSPCSADGTLLNSPRGSSDISADTQGREIPCTKFTDTSTVRNSTDRRNPEAFDGSCSKAKREYNFPKWSLPSKIRRKFSVPNKDSTDSEAVTSKSPDHSNGDHGPHSHAGSRNIAPRVCADCSTTKTPLWRSGPQGPKSLCNACGIRYRKKRRALIAAGNSDAATSIPSRKRNKSQLIAAEKKLKKCIASDPVEFMAFCQRQGMAALKDRQSVSFLRDANPNMAILHKHSEIRRRFAEEEEEAAVLLMALSYGVVNA